MNTKPLPTITLCALSLVVGLAIGTSQAGPEFVEWRVSDTRTLKLEKGVSPADAERLLDPQRFADRWRKHEAETLAAQAAKEGRVDEAVMLAGIAGRAAMRIQLSK